MMAKAEAWYVVKQTNGQCAIVSKAADAPVGDGQEWGPYATQQEAIARRIGLIRAGKCQPVESPKN